MKEAPSSKNTWALIIVFCLVIIFAISYLVIPRYLTDVKKLNLDLAVTQEKINKTQQKISDLQSLKTQFEDKKDLVDALNLAMPKSTQLPETIVSLNSLGIESGLTISSIQPVKTSASNDSNINLTIRGSYDNLKDFLSKLEKNIRPMAVNTFTIAQANSTDSTGNSSNSLDITLALSVFQIKSTSLISK